MSRRRGLKIHQTRPPGVRRPLFFGPVFCGPQRLDVVW